MLVQHDTPILPPLYQPRRRPIDPAIEAAFEESIRQHATAEFPNGRILSPLLVSETPEGLRLIAGSRRLAAARRLQIAFPVEIIGELDAAAEATASAVENVARLGLEPVDLWRVMVALQQRQMSLPRIAARLAITEAYAAQLDKLGSMHEQVLAAIEAVGLPPSRVLARIALAPKKKQAAALAAKGICKVDKGQIVHVDWMQLGNALTERRIPLSRAIFDPAVAKVHFDEDIFAEPDSPERFTTTQIDKFFAAQRKALEALAEASGGKMLVADSGQAPKGYRQDFGDVEKPKKHQVVFAYVSDQHYSLGEVAKYVAVDISAEKAAEKALKAKVAAVNGSIEPPEAAEKATMTQKGKVHVAGLKTAALWAALRETSVTLTPETLITALVLALHATNVSITGYTEYRDWKGESLKARLITPEGHFVGDADVVQAVARETLARVLNCSIEGLAMSGVVAEWLGHAIGAGRHLARCDTPELLGAMSVAELAKAAAECGIEKPAKKKGDLVAQLNGKFPDWRPSFADFGAAGPAAVVARANGGEEDGEEPDDEDGEGEDEQ